MQADQQLTLDVGGNRFQVVTSSPDVADQLRRALADRVVVGDAFLGFKVDSPPAHDPESEEGHQQPSGADLHVLLDCTGMVLARSHHRDAVLASLAGHLAALELGRPDGAVNRYRLRTLIAEDHAVLVAPPLFTRPPIVERRIAQLGYRVADVPFVDIDLESLILQSFDTPWSALAAIEPGAGHVSPAGLGKPVTHLLWPTDATAPHPTRAQICHAIATSTMTGAAEQRLESAEQLAAKIKIVQVPAGDDNAPYRALRNIDG